MDFICGKGMQLTVTWSCHMLYHKPRIIRICKVSCQGFNFHNLILLKKLENQG